MKKKLVFIDTETTGNEIGKDRLCQVCFKTYDDIKTAYFKPPVPVSVKAMSITHITNAMLKDKETFKGSSFSKELQKLLDEGILVAHNAKFDCSMLEAENMKVPQKICTLRVSRYLDKDNVIPEYGLQFLRYYLDLDVDAHAHDAEDDVKVLHALFQRLISKMIEEEGSEEKTIEKMLEISERPSLFTRFNFGKYKDKQVEEVLKTDRKYLEWLLKTKLDNKEDDEDWVYTLKHYLDR